jgi:hypothetical protein
MDMDIDMDTNMDMDTDSDRDRNSDEELIIPLLSHRQVNFEIGFWSLFCHCVHLKPPDDGRRSIP